LQDQDSRALVIASLDFVDSVVVFDEDTPLELIKLVMPDVLVKGGDYNINTIVGSDIVLGYGGKVEVVALLPGYSTTAIEEKILKGKR
jgi:rfaE bifunctional protein nucleotidyltransferase chain/domain